MLAGVLYERYPEKFRKINSERPALESIFHEDVGLQHATLSKIWFPVRLAKFFTRAFFAELIRKPLRALYFYLYILIRQKHLVITTFDYP